MNKNLKNFRYKGKTFMLIENELDFMSGFRVKHKGIELISVNKNLPKRKKQLELHRLITGRGLSDIKTGIKRELRKCLE